MPADPDIHNAMAIAETAGTWVSRAGEDLLPKRVSALSPAQRFDQEAMPHLGELLRTATRILGDRAQAEDVVQDAYLQAWRSFARFQSGTNCRAWLYKILFHCLHHHRRKWHRPGVLVSMDDAIENTAAYTPPIPEHLTDEDILAALENLPVEFRSVLILVDVEEFTYREAAEICAVPIGTVMSRISRGRRLLREQLAGLARESGYGKEPDR